MDGEPVDRRGLFRDLFRQATNAIAPALGDVLGPATRTAGASAGLTRRTATIEELLSAAADHGLQARSEAIERLTRRSLQLVPAAYAHAGPVAFGGRPLLEDGRQWPAWQGRPLTFLAQVETGEPLGRLLFFYDAVGRPSGCLAAHRGSACVLRAGGLLLPVDGPSLPEAEQAGLLGVELVLPPPRSEEVAALALSRQERDRWDALREELASLQGTELTDRPGAAFKVVHRILGYPDNGGAEMELTCELAMAGQDVIEGRAQLHPQAEKLARRASRWELLAQFSGDGKLGWPWVAQRVYFWVDQKALAAGDLGQVWAIAR